MVISPFLALGDSHISEPPSVSEGFEVLETVAEGYWSGRFGFRIAVPSAEFCDDPCGPSQRFRRMGVFLKCGLSAALKNTATGLGLSGFPV